MAGQPCACGGVASGNDVSNQARTAGENGASGSGAATASTLPMAADRACQGSARRAGWLADGERAHHVRVEVADELVAAGGRGRRRAPGSTGPARGRWPASRGVGQVDVVVHPVVLVVDLDRERPRPAPAGSRCPSQVVGHQRRPRPPRRPCSRRSWAVRRRPCRRTRPAREQRDGEAVGGGAHGGGRRARPRRFPTRTERSRWVTSLAAFVVVFLAELGDKTQLVALTLGGPLPGR